VRHHAEGNYGLGQAEKVLDNYLRIWKQPRHGRRRQQFPVDDPAARLDPVTVREAYDAALRIVWQKMSEWEMNMLVDGEIDVWRLHEVGESNPRDFCCKPLLAHARSRGPLSLRHSVLHRAFLNGQGEMFDYGVAQQVIERGVVKGKCTRFEKNMLKPATKAGLPIVRAQISNGHPYGNPCLDPGSQCTVSAPKVQQATARLRFQEPDEEVSSPFVKPLVQVASNRHRGSKVKGFALPPLAQATFQSRRTADNATPA
jgi:hypothetical protein